MAMSWVWILFLALSLGFGLGGGTEADLGRAALEGAGKALELGLRIAGGLCLWSGFAELSCAMRRTIPRQTASSSAIRSSPVRYWTKA